MRKYLINTSTLVCAIIATTASLSASAQMQQVLQMPTTQVVYVTGNGNVLASNLMEDFTGGIAYSEDQGNTWHEADVIDYNYSKFIEFDGDVYALGAGCILAKSADDGKTWDYVDYSTAAKPYAPKGRVENCVCYGAAALGNRLYVADLYCGVFYTEDKGETWTIADRESMTYKDAYGQFIENVYTLATFKDNLYALGLYSVFRYDEENDKWDYICNSNCLTVYTIFDGKMVCGRAIANDNEKADFLLWTDNGDDWSAVKRPQGMVDNYVRALTSDEHNIYVGLLSNGVHYTPDFGESWYDISDGLPKDRFGYYFTINLAQDADYIYAAIYQADTADTLSGVYRMAKADLPTYGGINNALVEKDNIVKVFDNVITITSEFSHAALYDMTGKKARTIKSATSDITSLPNGIYVCTVTDINGVVHNIKISK